MDNIISKEPNYQIHVEWVTGHQGIGKQEGGQSSQRSRKRNSSHKGKPHESQVKEKHDP